MQNKTDRKQGAIDVIDGPATHLHHPFLGGMLSDSCDRDAAPLQVQKEENVVGCQPAPGEHFDGEEVDTSKTGM